MSMEFLETEKSPARILVVGVGGCGGDGDIVDAG